MKRMKILNQRTHSWLSHLPFDNNSLLTVFVKACLVITDRQFAISSVAL